MIMNFNQLKRLADKCVFSMEGITVMKTEEYNYRLQQITQLTNNWNELEKWCKNNLGYYGSDIGIIYKYVLDKMKEINGGNK